MKIPRALQPLIDDGILDEVLRPLKSGKEASVFIVRSGQAIRCAKVYKDVAQRSFQQRTTYQEGRRVRGSRQARAMAKGTRFGRCEQEDAWKNTEVDALYRLAAAGVRVPRPVGFFDGVLVMEMITAADGGSAPGLGQVELTPEQARGYHAFLVRQVVRMLCAGLVHGDLSEYNVLVGPDGPVIIDLPQAVDAAGNSHARAMLVRDVNNVSAATRTFKRCRRAPVMARVAAGRQRGSRRQRAPDDAARDIRMDGLDSDSDLAVTPTPHRAGPGRARWR